MPDALKNFWDKNLEEIRANKIRFGAILIIAAAAIIFALSESAASDSKIILDAPAPAEIPAVVQPAAAEKVKPVLGANSSELYVQDPFKAPAVEIPAPPPAAVEPTVEILPEIPVAQIPPAIVQPPKPAEIFLLRGTAINGDSKSALIHKISGENKSAAENLIVSLGDFLGTRRVVDITANFIALDDGSKIFLTP